MSNITRSLITCMRYRIRKTSSLLYILIMLLLFDNILYSVRFSGSTIGLSAAVSNNILDPQTLLSIEGILLFVVIMFGSYLVGLDFISRSLKRITICCCNSIWNRTIGYISYISYCVYAISSLCSHCVVLRSVSIIFV
jgi:hypothetical protein